MKDALSSVCPASGFQLLPNYLTISNRCKFCHIILLNMNMPTSSQEDTMISLLKLMLYPSSMTLEY